MPKICEYCKQPYPDNLASCPNCDVFGAELVGGAPAGTPPIDVQLGPSAVKLMGDAPPSSSAVDLGGDLPGLETFTPASASAAPAPTMKPGSQQPATRVQGPLPPKPTGPSSSGGPKPTSPSAQGAPKPPAAGQPPTKAQPPAAPVQGAPSPLMAKAMQAKAPAAAETKGQPTTVGNAPGAPTMVAKQSSTPTMVATGSAPPTQLAPQDQGVLPIDPQHAQTAPQAAPPAAGKPPQAPAAPALPPGPPSKATMVSAQSAVPTMLAKQAQQTTLAPPDQAGPLPIEGQSQKATMLAKQAQQTMLAKAAGQTQLAPEGTQPDRIENDPNPKATMLGKPPQPTMLARPPQGETQLQGEEGVYDLPAGGKQTMLARPAQPQTTLAPTDKPGELPPGMKKTMLPDGGRQKTQLQAEVYELPEGDKKKTMLAKPPQAKTQMLPPEGLYDLPADQKKTMLPPGHGQKTSMAPDKPYALPTKLANRQEHTTLVPGEMMKDEMGGEPEPVIEPKSEPEIEALQQPVVVQQARPRMWLRWLGGTLIGLLLAGGGLYGFLFGLPRDQTRAPLGAVDLKWKDEPDDALREAIEALNAGQFDKAVSLIENWSSDGYTPRHAAVAGEARWLRYLQNTPRDSWNREDGQVSKAITEMTEGLKDNTANAELFGPPRAKESAYFLAHIDETFNELDRAKAAFTKGGETFRTETPRFESAIIRIETRPVAVAKGKTEDVEPKEMKKDEPKIEEKKEEPKKDEPKEEKKEQARNADALEMLAVLVTLQQGGAPEVDEAGYKIWEAQRALKAGDFKAAQEALRQAQALHEKYRFKRLRQAQNPKSDPTEELFGRLLADALIVAQVREKLQKYPEYKDKSIPDAVELAVLRGQTPDQALAKIAKLLGVPNDIGEIMKAMESVPLDRAIAALVKDGLIKGKYVKDDERDEDELKKTSKFLVEDALTKLKMHQTIEKEGFKDPNAEVALDLLLKDRQDFIDRFLEIAKNLQDNDYLRMKIDVISKGDRPEVVRGVDRAIDAARSPLAAAIGRSARNILGVAGRTTTAAGPSFDLASQLAAAQAHIGALNFRLMQVRSSRDMMNFWPAVLEEARGRKEILDAAAADARHVLDPNFAADEVAKAQAHTVAGLVQRNSEQFDEARASLQQALKIKQAGPANWRSYAENAHKELTDPTFYYIPRANDLANSSKFQQAVDLLKSGIGAFPKEGRLMALKSLAQLELAKDKVAGRLTAQEPLIQAARQDAQSAIANGSVAEGNFALGRVAEDLDDRLAAEKHFRTAIAAHPDADNASSRYRVALGRILLKLNPIKPTPIPPPPRRPAGEEKAPEPAKVGQADRIAPLAEEQEERVADSTDRQQVMSMLLALILPVPVVVDDENPDLDEIIRLAEQAIKAKNYEGYLIKARALARKGQWTRALREYSEGLKYLIPPNYAQGLAELVDNHPAINLPDSLRIPDPLRAEKHFGNGLRFYFAGQYANAESEFIEAYRNNGQDARYLYYLGLSRLPQRDKTQAANVNFEMAALLERQNKPSPSAINQSLERVQGPLRQRLEGYRP